MNNQTIQTKNAKTNQEHIESNNNLPIMSGPSKEVWFWILVIIIGAGILVIIASYLAV